MTTENDLKIEFMKKTDEIIDLFEEKTKVYGTLYFDRNDTGYERFIGGLQRKLHRAETYYKKEFHGGEKGEETEMIEETLRDIAVYAIMELVKREVVKSEKEF